MWPALLTSTSRRPDRSMTRPTAASTDASSSTSSSSGRTSPSTPSRSAAARLAFAPSGSRIDAYTVWPRAASDRQARAPIPVAAPVMSTVEARTCAAGRRGSGRGGVVIRSTSIASDLDHRQGEHAVADAPATVGHFFDQDHGVGARGLTVDLGQQVGDDLLISHVFFPFLL